MVIKIYLLLFRRHFVEMISGKHNKGTEELGFAARGLDRGQFTDVEAERLQQVRIVTR
jgi:hypothetical protein